MDRGAGRRRAVGLHRSRPLPHGTDLLPTRPDAGAVGPRLLLSSGRLDPDSRRAFPIPRTLFYQTVGLSKLFPKSKRFGRLNMGHLPEDDVHEMDAGTAACLMLRRSALDRVGFFDPRYFLFGEDLEGVGHGVDGVGQDGDLALGLDGDLLAQVAAGHRSGHLGDVADLDLGYRLKLVGWKVFYLPGATATRSARPLPADRRRQVSYERHRAMWTYHFKHHSEDVSAFANGLVWAQIWGRYVADRVRSTLGGDRHATA